MKKNIIIIIILSLTTNLFAEEASIPDVHDSVFFNLREGKSRFINGSKEREIKKIYLNTQAGVVLRNSISENLNSLCASRILFEIKDKLHVKSSNDVELAILGMRQEDLIDDVVVDILIKSVRTHDLSINPFVKDSLNSEEETKIIEILHGLEKEIHNEKSCIDDTYKKFVSKISTLTPKVYKNLKHINNLALDNNVISNSEYLIFEKLRKEKIFEWPMTLSEYGKKLERLRGLFPTRRKESSSDYKDPVKKSRDSLRQLLYERYSPTQIILLANIVKDLKIRLESASINVNINYVDRVSEIINLSPMEKFRFILKLLRKELANINNGTLLEGKSASFLDIIAASYEVGYISSNEINSFLSLQEIWNPSKTPKEKVMYWVNTFGGLASVLLPSPFGLVAVMAIMLIDHQLASAPIDRDSDFNLL